MFTSDTFLSPAVQCVEVDIGQCLHQTLFWSTAVQRAVVDVGRCFTSGTFLVTHCTEFSSGCCKVTNKQRQEKCRPVLLMPSTVLVQSPRSAALAVVHLGPPSHTNRGCHPTPCHTHTCVFVCLVSSVIFFFFTHLCFVCARLAG